jgi:hypothetical protein
MGGIEVFGQSQPLMSSLLSARKFVTFFLNSSDCNLLA